MTSILTKGLVMLAIFWLIDTVIGIYISLLIFSIVLSCLININIINTNNRFIYIISDLLYRLTDPILKKIRGIIPNISGIDLSPIILIVILKFLNVFLQTDLRMALLGY